MASERLDEIVNDCLERMASGEPVEACLASYLEDRGQLAPLLKTAAKTLMAATTVGPDAMARQGGLQKFNEAVAQSKTRANKEAERCPPLLRSGARSSVIPEHGDHHLPLGVPSNHRRFIKSAAPTICSRGSRSVMKSTTKTPEYLLNFDQKRV
ncbi:MAG: hypothetical protein OTJ97_07450 [SAR202 cluster bacterium]|nr:hypothetical protein [SAR202 cluster bacterium]